MKNKCRNFFVIIFVFLIIFGCFGNIVNATSFKNITVRDVRDDIGYDDDKAHRDQHKAWDLQPVKIWVALITEIEMVTFIVFGIVFVVFSANSFFRKKRYTCIANVLGSVSIISLILEVFENCIIKIKYENVVLPNLDYTLFTQEELLEISQKYGNPWSITQISLLEIIGILTFIIVFLYKKTRNERGKLLIKKQTLDVSDSNNKNQEEIDSQYEYLLRKEFIMQIFLLIAGCIYIMLVVAFFCYNFL